MSCSRAFPGPAGAISKDNRVKTKVATGGDEFGESIRQLLDEGPWKEVKKPYIDGMLDPSLKHCRTIKCIHDNFPSFRTSWKLPFVLGVMMSIPKLPTLKAEKNECQTVVIVDESGSIDVAFDPAVVSKLQGLIEVGSCIALQNIGVLNLRGKLMLMCTLKNLVAVYRTRKRDEKCSSQNGIISVCNDVVTYKFV